LDSELQALACIENGKMLSIKEEIRDLSFQFLSGTEITVKECPGGC
jgi:hypothetical protein